MGRWADGQYQWPPLNPLWHKILMFAMTMLGSFSMLGNGLVVYVFTTTKALRTPSNLFVVNLAFSDFCMMFCMCPAMVVNCYHETWSFGPTACALYAMTGSLFGNTSIWTMIFIALDRYNVIVKGLSGKPLTISGAMIRIGFIWLQGLAWTLAPMFGWNRYVPEGNMTACGTDYLTQTWNSRSYIMAYSVFVYFLPLLTIIWAYSHIVKTVAEHEKNMREQAKKMNVTSLRSAGSGADQQKSADIKLAKVALMTISLWFMAWTPYLIINYAGIFQLMTISPLTTIWGSVFAKANAVYNPIVYAISHPKYRAALNKKIPSLVCGEVQGAGADAQSTVSQTTA
ncbi:hypothetical protein V9T40_004623 [Parthenolecanium corni]|uniref:G-protein coupled receptors family 1 profile domain-containing protein n=1 Tax=Parthenolecanium corni TaxID=536013 RepID=A0AAN9TEU7_9HEMI